jgi:hypothetical protein
MSGASKAAVIELSASILVFGGAEKADCLDENTMF